MFRFFESVRAKHPSSPAVSAPYEAWHAWSCANPALFWSEVWRFTNIISSETKGRDPWDSVVHGFDRMAPPSAEQGPVWFTGARLNFAENLLRGRGNAAAIIFRDESGARRELSHDALTAEVARVAGALRAMGIRAGDRVA
jgi:acetoacetyl-CoA synthetase